MRHDEKTLATMLEKEAGGRRAAEQSARSAWEKACIEESPAVDHHSPDHLAPPPSNSAQPSSDEDAAQAAALRHRRVSGRRRSNSPFKHRGEQPPKPSRGEEPQEGFETLTWHPEDRIAHLAMSICDAKDALSSGGKEAISFPNNITLPNFVDYLLVPTLVYELEYPRTKSIRPLYVLEKTLATFGTFTLLILVVEHFILPNMPRQDQTFFASVLGLALPFCVCYLLIFFIIFECICNAFAEVSAAFKQFGACARRADKGDLQLTRFSDRAFYSDWWNSTSFDEVRCDKNALLSGVTCADTRRSASSRASGIVRSTHSYSVTSTQQRSRRTSCPSSRRRSSRSCSVLLCTSSSCWS